jgi:hypothetical protein
MESKNKGAGEDMKFIFWDDVGDSQDHVDNQCDCPPWKTEITYNELRKPCCSARARQEDLLEQKRLDERMRVIMQNGNTGEHYQEYNEEEQDDEK